MISIAWWLITAMVVPAQVRAELLIKLGVSQTCSLLLKCSLRLNDSGSKGIQPFNYG
jgi:hypothetical protein